MGSRAPGIRVSAWLSADDDEVRALGAGVYEGDFVPDDTATGFAADVREAGLSIPRIRLDSGAIVWGCECWWGPEDAMNAKVAGRAVVIVDVATVRARNQEDAADGK